MVYIANEDDMDAYYEVALAMIGEGPKQQRQFRAFCPGASPPDNSCSPANKGDGAEAGMSDYEKYNKARIALSENRESLAAVRERLVSERKQRIDELKGLNDEWRRKWALHENIVNKAAGLQDRRREANRKMLESPDDASAKAEHEAAKRELADVLEAMKYSGEEADALRAKIQDTHRAIRQAAAIALRDEAESVIAEDGNGSLASLMRTDVQGFLQQRQNIGAGPKEGVKPHLESAERLKKPYNAQAIDDANSFAVEAFHPVIFGQAMTTRVEIVDESVRANAEVVRHDFHYTDQPAGYYGGIRYSVTQVPDGAGTSTYLHEMAHHMEHASPEIRDIVADFRLSRLGSQQEVSLSQRFPSAGYRDHEYGAPDDFVKAFRAAGYDEATADRLAHYAGKRYTDSYDNYGPSTEVLTMGVELMHRDPVAFAEADPEWFDLVSGVVTGRILKRTRQKIKEGKPYVG